MSVQRKLTLWAPPPLLGGNPRRSKNRSNLFTEVFFRVTRVVLTKERIKRIWIRIFLGWATGSLQNGFSCVRIEPLRFFIVMIQEGVQFFSPFVTVLGVEYYKRPQRGILREGNEV